MLLRTETPGLRSTHAKASGPRFLGLFGVSFFGNPKIWGVYGKFWKCEYSAMKLWGMHHQTTIAEYCGYEKTTWTAPACLQHNHSQSSSAKRSNSADLASMPHYSNHLPTRACHNGTIWHTWVASGPSDSSFAPAHQRAQRAQRAHGQFVCLWTGERSPYLTTSHPTVSAISEGPWELMEYHWLEVGWGWLRLAEGTYGYSIFRRTPIHTAFMSKAPALGRAGSAQPHQQWQGIGVCLQLSPATMMRIHHFWISAKIPSSIWLQLHPPLFSVPKSFRT